jgi:murein DD-endopeptidase MepM/ murein hydrolase activator NlpD
MPQKNRKDPVKGKKSKNHDGLDVAVNAKRNQPVITPKGGVVEKSILETEERGPYNGNYVIIKHDDGYRSYFLHLQEPSKLKKGDVIEKGDLVGIVGNSGRSAGIHLHYAIKKGREWQLPQDILLDEWKV